MFKHIKDGYYIVHDESELKSATEHYCKDYTDNEDNNKILSVIRKYPSLIHIEPDFDRKGNVICLYASQIPLADLKAALGDENVT